MRGIDEQIGKAEKAVAGKVAVERNRFIRLAGGTRSVNRELEAKTRALAGWKGYTTNLVDATPEFVIGAYHQLWHVEKSFRMSKHDLRSAVRGEKDEVSAYRDVGLPAVTIVGRRSRADRMSQ